MRTVLAAVTAVLFLALTPAAAHAEEVPEVTLSVASIVYDPLEGATQTIRIGGNPSAVVRVYVDGDSVDRYVTIWRGGGTCNNRAPCAGTGDITITYSKIDPLLADLYNEGRVSTVVAMAYVDAHDQVGEYIARAEGTVTVRFEFDAQVWWSPDQFVGVSGPQFTVAWRVDGPPLVGIGSLRPAVTIRLQGLGAYRGISTDSSQPPQCAPAGSDVVCNLAYGYFHRFSFNLVSCPSRDVSISISTDYYDPNSGNNHAYVPVSAHSCAGAGTATVGGSGGGSGGGPSGGTGVGSAPAPSSGPSAGPSSTTVSPTPSDVAVATRSAVATSLAAAPVSDADRGSGWPAFAGAIGAVLAIGATGGWWLWRRRNGVPATDLPSDAA